MQSKNSKNKNLQYFRVLETRNVIFSQEVLKKDSNDLPDDLKKMICTNKSLREYIIQRGSCASVGVYLKHSYCLLTYKTVIS